MTIRSALSLVVCLFVATGCRRTPGPDPTDYSSPVGSVSTTSPSKRRVTVTDGLGRAVDVPAGPLRIISLAPRNTEILFAIGAGEQVVGVTTLCNFPPEAQER